MFSFQYNCSPDRRALVVKPTREEAEAYRQDLIDTGFDPTEVREADPMTWDVVETNPCRNSDVIPGERERQ
jgi:hypothetical protein